MLTKNPHVLAHISFIRVPHICCGDLTLLMNGRINSPWLYEKFIAEKLGRKKTVSWDTTHQQKFTAVTTTSSPSTPST